jgi:hypothetical protein
MKKRRPNKPPYARFARIIFIMKQFLLEILRQITGGNLRKTKLIITYWANVQKIDLGLDMETIEEVLETGRRIESKIKNYGKYSISVSYKWDEKNNQYVITSVRKYENEERPVNKKSRWERRWK